MRYIPVILRKILQIIDERQLYNYIDNNYYITYSKNWRCKLWQLEILEVLLKITF